MGLLQAVTGIFRRRASTPAPGDDYWYSDYSAKNASGVIITPDLALKAAAVYACVKVLAEIIASLPIAMFAERPDGGRSPAPNHPLDELLRFQPNSWQTAIEFWEMMMMHAVLRGTAYSEIKPGPRGAVDQLIPLHTDRVRVERLQDYSLRFIISELNGTTRTLLQEEVFRIPGLSSDGIKGVRVIDLAAEDIGLGMAADAYASRVFSNKLNIGGFLIHPAKLSPEAQKNLVQRLMERFAGIDNAHRPIVLQEGMKFEKASMDADKAQLLEARKFQTTLIAQRFRIPLYMLGIDKAGANAEQDAVDLVKYTLRPWVRRIEQAIRRDLIVARNIYSAKFNVDALLRGDSKSRAEYFSKALGSGGSPAWLTQNEVRIIEGYNPVDDPRADTLGVGTNPVTGNPAPKAIADETTKAKAERLIRKETAAIRKAAQRFADDPDAFRKWATAFYGGHASTVMKALGVEKNVARAYCATVCHEVTHANDLEGLLVRWEDSGAEEIVATLERHEHGEDDEQ